jgi:hypothetical protein
MATAKSKTIYDVHPSFAMVQKRLADMKEESFRLEQKKDALGEKTVLS